MNPMVVMVRKLAGAARKASHESALDSVRSGPNGRRLLRSVRPEPQPGIRANDVVRVGVLLFAVGWGANHFVPLLLVYRTRLSLSAVDLATLFAVYALGLVPGLLIGGPQSDRRGRGAIVLPAAMLALAGTALLAAGAADFGLLLAGRLVVGLGSGAVFSAGTAWMQDLSRNEPPGTGPRRAAIALSCGFGGGPLIAGASAQWLGRPLLSPYLLQAAALGGAIVLAWPAAGAAKLAAAGAPAPEGPPQDHLPAGFFQDLGIVAPWVFAFPSIAFVVLPAQVRTHLGAFAIVYAGLVAAVTLTAGILIQPVARVRPARHVATAGLLTGALGLGAGRFATSLGSPWAVVVAAVLLGVGYGTCLIAGLRWIEAMAPLATRGGVTGVFYLLTYLGFWAPMLLATLARRTSDGVAMWLTSALALASAAFTGLRRWRNDQRDFAPGR
jgi:MFS family permease